jgi:hypothetical protein
MTTFCNRLGLKIYSRNTLMQILYNSNFSSFEVYVCENHRKNRKNDDDDNDDDDDDDDVDVEYDDNEYKLSIDNVELSEYYIDSIDSVITFSDTFADLEYFDIELVVYKNFPFNETWSALSLDNYPTKTTRHIPTQCRQSTYEKTKQLLELIRGGSTKRTAPVRIQ